MIGVWADVHPAPVDPTVARDKFVHSDDEEGPGGVVVQRETALRLPLVVFICPYQVIVIVVKQAEVLGVALPAVWIFTAEVKCLTLHTVHLCGYDTGQTCKNESVLGV